MQEPTVLIDGLGFPEGPRWHQEELWLSDLVSKTVSSVTLAGVQRTRATLDDRPSGIGFLPGGTPVVVSMSRKQIVRLEEGKAVTHADLADVPGDYLNDMLADPDGRLYVGHRSAALRPRPVPLDDSSAGDGITIVEPDGSVRLGAPGMISPNGTVLSAGGDILIVAETYAQRISAFTRTRDGSLGRRRVFAETPGCYPDGICLDETGAVWLASPYTDEFVRVREGGEIVERVPMPGGVACALGGADGHTLFLLGVTPSMLPAVEGTEGPSGEAGEQRTPLRGRIATTRVADAAAGWQ